MSPVLALFGHHAMPDFSPECAPKRHVGLGDRRLYKSQREPATTDPDSNPFADADVIVC
jgi:hypothetical protein